jgi:bla regulator protein BlaR1
MMGPDMVTIIISVLIKPVLLLLIIGVLFWFLRKTSAALQHFCLLTGFIALLVLPVSAFLIPDMAWQFPFSQFLFDLLPFDWKEYLLKTSYIKIQPLGWQITLAIYLSVSTSILFYLLIGYVQMWMAYRKSMPVTDADTLAVVNELRQLLGINRTIRLVTSKNIESPCVWGFWQPTIFLPQAISSWTHEQKISVLMHELGHIHRNDTLSLVIIKIVCAIFWFLPPVWWLAKKMSLLAEVACDDLIYQLRNKHVQYAEHLLELADHHTSSPVTMPMSGHSEIYQRIMAVLDTKKPRDKVQPEKVQYPILLAVLLLVLMAGISTIEWSPKESNISKVRLVWPKSESPKIFPVDPSIADAENSLIKASWIENQDKPVMEVSDLPLLESDVVNLKNQYTLNISKQDIEAEQTENRPLLPATYKVIKPIQPEYPQAAIKKGLSGYVKVKFIINQEGIADKIQIIESQPAGVFDQSIIAAVEKAQFKWQTKPDPQLVIQQRFSFQLEKPRTR